MWDEGVPIPDRQFDMTIPNDHSYAKLDDGRNQERKQAMLDFDSRNNGMPALDNPRFIIKVK